jgi:hypothetical protein
MTLRTFYAYAHEAPPAPPEAPGPWDSDDPHHVKWGYNIADLAVLSRIAVARCRAPYLSYLDGYEASWSAIAEALAVAEAYPDEHDLLRAGWSAVNAAASRYLRYTGRRSHADDPMPKFARYWGASPAPSHEDRIVERTALYQVLPTLNEMHRRAVYAMAATGSRDTAAAAVGVSPVAFESRLRKARRAVLALWFEGETPPRHWRQSKPARTSRITERQLEQIRDRSVRGESHASIAPDFGISKTMVSLLLSGKSRPAPEGTP